MVENPEVAFGGSARMLGLIERIYAAAVEPGLWHEAMREVLRAVEGDSIALYAGAPDARTPALVSMQGDSLDAWDDFASYYAAINPIYPACQKMFRADETWYSELAMPDREFEKTEFYNDFYRPNKMFYSVGLLLEMCRGTGVSAGAVAAPAASISIQRDRPSGGFTGHTEIVCQTLRPHLQRALQLHYQMSGLETKVAGLEAALEAHAQALVGLDTAGQVAFCSPAATRLLQRGLLRVHQERLACRRTADDQRLQTTIASVLAGAPGGATHVHGTKGGLLRVSVTRFCGSLRGSSKTLAALVFVNDSDATALPRSALLRDLYSLSPAECRIAEMLLAGYEIRAVSETLRITLETARFNVKRILTKTQTHKQSALIALMLSLPGVS